MTNKLSYPGLKCVLEYLEANRRIYITARSPALQRVEKSIPIHLEFLAIEEDGICVNYIEMSPSNCNEIMFKRGKKCYKWYYPMKLEFEKAKEKMRQYYLGGRMSVYADEVNLLDRLENSAKFNVTTNRLYVYYLNDSLQYINPNSFPLKQLTVECYEDFNHPHIRSANSLQILRRLHLYDDVDGILTQLRNEFSEIMSELTGVNDQKPAGTPGFSIPLTSSSKILVYERGNKLEEEFALKVVSSQADDNTMEMEHQ
ncbi:hypothetical protein GCK72_000500 [Caenorhabditis remanei]|uniref:DUF38 domain-containing protein n=1 Tax=Caenorhabditis remanei TaxID=31234 RepID=A0A6A5HQV4_CAERE|nr:hypothetical protein GCK72_000500 [Caenorhabditis remanei]KAF1768687.1 hypothetical protein GCK72_000500 [Caenorhabditis remanei]